MDRQNRLFGQLNGRADNRVAAMNGTPVDRVQDLMAVTALAILLVATGTTGAFAQIHSRTSNQSAVPSFDVRSICRTIDPTVETSKGCAASESAARDQLVKTWPQYSLSQRADCVASMSELPSYVELQACLQMARDVENDRAAEDSSKPAGLAVSIPAGGGDYVSPQLPSDPPSTGTPPVVQPYKPPSITTFSDRVSGAIQSYPLQRGIGNNPTNMQEYIRQKAN